MNATDRTNEPDETRLAAWRALLNAQAAAVGAIERDLAAAGHIPLLWYDVLVALSEAPDERLRMHELAERVVLSRSGLTRLVDRLEGAGLLCRAACPGDRRGAFAVLTAAGRAALARTWPAYARGIDEHFARYLTLEAATAVATALAPVSVAKESAARADAAASDRDGCNAHQP
ncbi:MAG TPA: MarR family transcriptional regulator [Thermomicrobiales bacterium]|nr:MarR family transcriptional regulator [Thermomicrobiales bacterium]